MSGAASITALLLLLAGGFCLAGALPGLPGLPLVRSRSRADLGRLGTYGSGGENLAVVDPVVAAGAQGPRPRRFVSRRRW